jgi:hypothetical protein
MAVTEGRLYKTVRCYVNSALYFVPAKCLKTEYDFLKIDVRVFPSSERNPERHVFTRVRLVETYSLSGLIFRKLSKHERN